MHEEALLRDLRRKLEEVALREPTARIVRVRLWIGGLSHVTDTSVRARWDDTVRGTAAERSTLEVECSSDLHDPRADRVVLLGVDVDDGSPPATVISDPARSPRVPGVP
ncbi:MAG TPA: hydrogenase/urease maturation nickel metallochaperone HypA [Thermoplasmata archaeon]|nr:hydrogenase/urease maturation nickel metallochaperone HypA [Thermoplasmata archaeon]